MYHQIDAIPERGENLRGLVVSPGTFRRQMMALRLLGYTGLSMKALEPYVTGVKRGKVVGITFDDGFRNNLDHALPTMQSLGFSATCYAVSQLLGKTNQWDAGVVRSSLLMSASELRAWHDAGMDVGSHTRHHADLTRINDDQALDEVKGSKFELEQAIGAEVRHFCYPYGRYSNHHVDMVKAAGYHSATTTQRGRSHALDDPMTLKRVLVTRTTHPALFIAKLLTRYEDRRSEFT